MLSKIPQLKKSNRDKKIQLLLILEGVINLTICLIKLMVGVATGSIAILADSIHSLSDFANNVIAWIVIRLSASPADREHPYGHRKFETIAIFFLATLLTVLAFEIAQNAFTKNNTEVVSGKLEILLMSSVLVINIALAAWQRYWAKRLNSGILLADAFHTFADILTTLIVIVGWQLSVKGYLIVDKICAFGVALLIFYLAYRLFKNTLPILVDGYAIDPDKIQSVALGIDGVLEVDSIRSRWKGSDIAVDMVLKVAPDLSTSESHRIADKVEAVIERELYVSEVFIHVEPYIK